MHRAQPFIKGLLWVGALFYLVETASAAQTPLITSPPQTFMAVSVPMTPFQITALYSPTSFSASGLPPGLTVDPVAGIICGTPTSQGTFNATITATNSAGTGQAPLSINVTTPPFPPPVTSSLTDQAIAGVPYNYQIINAGAGNYQADGLPPGLSLGLFTGIISGTPTTQGLYLVKFLMQHATTAASTAVLVLTVVPGAGPLPVITSAANAQGQVDTAFTYPIAASNNPTSYYAAGLPPGLFLNTATGLISGTPALAGTFNVLLNAINANGSGSLSLSLTINPAVTQLPAITSPLTALGIANNLFAGFYPYQITATGDPTSFSTTGLPPGLSFDPTIALIYGTPTQAGTFPITLTASNSAGSGTATLVITIEPAGTLPPVVTNPGPAVIRLGDVAGAPGSNIALPIYFTPSPDLGGSTLGIDITLPPRVRLGSADPASLGQAAIDAGEEAGSNAGYGRLLLLSFTLNALGPGPMLILNLHIDSGIPGGVLPVSLANVGLSGDSVDTSGNTTVITIPVTVLDGAVTVNGPPPTPSLT